VSDKITMSWEGNTGQTVTRDVNQIIDVRDFVGTPGYPLLLMAANTNLSIADLNWILFMQSLSHKNPKIERSRTWCQRRRWLFQQPGTVNAINRADRDGNEERAARIMSEHPSVSVRDLTAILKDNGIARSREWVRQRRCGAVAGPN
jgi:hypothetical protein